MDKVKRNDRIAAITRILSGRPNEVVGFSTFCEMFGAAKSSISEDIDIVDRALRQQGLGQLETLAGAAGGVRFRPCGLPQDAHAFIAGLAERLCEPSRLLAGGYIYLSDILGEPQLVRRMGEIIACAWYEARPDFVLTMETKGIPVAMLTASALGIPLVIARRESRVYEGSSVNISYPTRRGSIETMSLSRRAVREGQRALVVDDFTRDGGTARGLSALMQEFSVPIVGMSFILAQDSPSRELLPHEKSLMLFSGDGEQAPLKVRPASWLAG